MSRTSAATQRLNRASRKADEAFRAWDGSGEKAEGARWEAWQQAVKDAEAEYHEARAAQARKERGY